MSEVQAVTFYKNKWTADQARQWLDANNFKRMKRVDITPQLLRYRITNPKKYDRFITKTTTQGINFVIGFKKQRRQKK